MNSKLFLFCFFISLGFFKAQTVTDSVILPSKYSSADTLKLKSGVILVKTDSLLKSKIETQNQLYPKKFEKKYLDKYKGNDFNYSEIKPHESFWSKIQRKILEWIRTIFGDVETKSFKFTDVMLKLIGIIVIGILLYFIVKYFMEKQGNFFFGKKNRRVTDIRNEDLHENIHEINFPESILKFEKQHDYRSAIRYQFLFVLKKLSDKNHISWNPEKTNKDYVQDLKDSSLSTSFQNLSYIFDYVWYGEFSIDETQYTNFKNQFQNFSF